MGDQGYPYMGLVAWKGQKSIAIFYYCHYFTY